MDELKAAITRQPYLPRFLCHIHQRLNQQRLNLVTGAGISVDAGVPAWFKLLERLAENSMEPHDVITHRESGLSPEYLGQIIYHRHRSINKGGGGGISAEAAINHSWAESIHKVIYKDVPNDIAKVITTHPYLESLVSLVHKVPFIINFNFDDILAQSISHKLKSDRYKNSFSVEWRPPLLDRRNNTIIYHVNGILPQSSLKKRSPKLIFTEDSFTDALTHAPGGSIEYIFMRFLQNTMLIIGHSLGDVSLKNYLRKNREKSPANHHYMIYWIKNDDFLTAAQRLDIFEANLELYNLITIFITSSEIKEFLDILNLDQRQFRDKLDEMGNDRRSCYHYYIVGPVASGKSSLLEYLRCFETYEEWTQPPPPEMYLSFDKLNAEQSKKVDSFIYSELKEKNKRLSDAGIGFHFMDRAPLDLYAFSASDEERKLKTIKIKELVTRNKILQEGEILFLSAKGSTLVERNYGRGRRPEDAGNNEYFDTQKKLLRDIYKPNFELETDNISAAQVARLVVRHVLLDNYLPIDLNKIMERYA